MAKTIRLSDGALAIVIVLVAILIGVALFAPTRPRTEQVCVRAVWENPSRYVSLNILISEKQYHNDVMTLLPLSYCREGR